MFHSSINFNQHFCPINTALRAVHGVNMDIEKNVQEFFAECGIKAKKIPERKEDGFKSPDFEIHDEVSILVEVKEKLDDKLDIIIIEPDVYQIFN